MLRHSNLISEILFTFNYFLSYINYIIIKWLSGIYSIILSFRYKYNTDTNTNVYAKHINKLCLVRSFY